MMNKERQAETKVDSEQMPIAGSSAQMPQNPMLVAVLSAILSAFEWVKEDSFVGWFWDEFTDFFVPVIKSKTEFNYIGLITLYPLLVIITFTISFTMFIIFSTIAVVLGTIGYTFIGIVMLGGLLFMKRDVSKNSH